METPPPLLRAARGQEAVTAKRNAGKGAACRHAPSVVDADAVTPARLYLCIARRAPPACPVAHRSRGLRLPVAWAQALSVRRQRAARDAGEVVTGARRRGHADP
jgi:hypothetical protein